MHRTEFEVQAPDGRRLVAEVAGPGDGVLLVDHAGTPGTRHAFQGHLHESAKRGLRQVTYSRPGYEGSERLAGRSFADCVADTVAVVDALGVDSFYVSGHSGGVPHALACAAKLPSRVLAVAAVSGLAPRDADGLDWLAGMGRVNVDEFAALVAGDAALQVSIEKLSATMLASKGATGIEATFDDCYCEADLKYLVEPFVGWSFAGFERSISTGIWGWFDDDKAAFMDWGFALSDIEIPVTIWFGEEDRFVPPAHGLWLSERIPTASFHLLAGEGHVSMQEGYHGEVLDELLSLGARDSNFSPHRAEKRRRRPSRPKGNICSYPYNR
jgi:pimeloyl-ACP methyl ester carboxylesterase